MSDLIDGERYEYVGGTSRKFWEWRLYSQLEKDEYTVRFSWGRLGTAGQSMIETFTDRRLAEWKAKVKVKEKVGKGYKLASSAVRQRNTVSDREARLRTMNEEARVLGRKVLGLREPKRTTMAEVIGKKEPDAAPLLTGVRRVTLRD